MPRFRTRTPSSTSAPEAMSALAAACRSPSYLPVTRTIRLGMRACVSASYATPSASWRTTVNRYLPGVVGRATGTRSAFFDALTVAGETTSPTCSATTRSDVSAGASSRWMSSSPAAASVTTPDGVMTPTGVSGRAAASIAPMASVGASAAGAVFGAAAASVGAAFASGATGAKATSIGSHRTLASRPFGSDFRSLILNGMSRVVLEPADGSAAKLGDPSLMPVPTRVGARSTAGRDDVETVTAVGEPAAPASTSFGASPAFMTIDREKPDVAVRVSIWPAYPLLRSLSKAIRWPFALGLLCQALWIERPPPRMAFTKYEGLWYASAMTAAAPALMKPAA